MQDEHVLRCVPEAEEPAVVVRRDIDQLALDGHVLDALGSHGVQDALIGPGGCGAGGSVGGSPSGGAGSGGGSPMGGSGSSPGRGVSDCMVEIPSRAVDRGRQRMRCPTDAHSAGAFRRLGHYQPNVSANRCRNALRSARLRSATE